MKRLLDLKLSMDDSAGLEHQYWELRALGEKLNLIICHRYSLNYRFILAELVVAILVVKSRNTSKSVYNLDAERPRLQLSLFSCTDNMFNSDLQAAIVFFSWESQSLVPFEAPGLCVCRHTREDKTVPCLVFILQWDCFLFCRPIYLVQFGHSFQGAE